ncbi:MAG: SDR family NAD(P)-dependent oxidoreductase [Deltaproteobacteria bacterium]
MFSWKGKNVLVTGGDGFIGAWLAKVLEERGARVVILIRDLKREFAYRLLGLEEKVTGVVADLTDPTAVSRLIHEFATDTVFHLAAQTLVQTAQQSPLSTFEANIRGTWHLLEACRTSGHVRRIVVASSDKAYGVQKKLPYSEESPLSGLYPYDASKACTDILARSYFVSYGLPVAVTRNANTYGGGDLNFSRIVPDAVCCVLKGKRFLIRSDGTPVRDYMYVEDAAEGYRMLAEQLHRRDVAGEAFNFGSGEPVSVLELFRRIARQAGRPDARPKVLGRAKNEIDRQYLSIRKVRRILGWKPRHSLNEGLDKTIAWYKTYLARKRTHA